MCGRFTLTATPQALEELFPLFAGLDLVPNYNVAPTQTVLAVRQKAGADGLEAVPLRWGLIPSWSKDLKIGYRMINARSETVRTQPAFRTAFKQRRCLILADGFYEWQKQGKLKQPFHMRMKDGKPFAFAGLWERWRDDEQCIESCTILTTEANDLVRPMHERMPVILNRSDHDRWLDASASQDTEMLRPFDPSQMVAVAVSSHVNNTRNNDPACLQAM